MTARARTKIKAALKEEEKKIAEEGKAILTRKLRHLKITLNDRVVNEMASYFSLKTSFDLFYRIGNGAIDNKQLKAFANQKNNAFISFFKNRLKRSPSKENFDKEEVTNKYDALVFGDQDEKLDYTLSKCCNPIPGDKVFGFLTINDGIKIHKKDCPNAISMQSNYAYRVLKATWIDSSKQEFKAILKVSGNDKKGIVNNLTRIITNTMDVYIHNINISGDHGVFEGKLSISVKNKTQLTKLIASIKKVEGVQKVERVNTM